jgi:methylmalonyl-CoA mutase C-terminal domain/subunit
MEQKLSDETAVHQKPLQRPLQRPLRVLICKIGLDGHDRGAVVVARALRDAGMEVIYTGRHQKPEAVVAVAADEDVDVVGLSSLSDSHRSVCPKVAQLLRERGLDDVLFILGGFVPEEDFPALKEAGVAEIFGSGSALPDIVSYIRTHVRRG